MNTLAEPTMIRTAAVWTRDDAASEFTLQGSLYGGLDSESTDAIIDRIQSQPSPVVISQYASEITGSAAKNGAVDNGATAQKRELASKAIVGIPVFQNEQVRSILAFSVECPKESMGAVEIWRRDSRDELGLNGGVFSRLSQFAKMSQFVRFPRGSGLPGQCWEGRCAKIITGLGNSTNFMRAAGARAGGVDIGIGLPVMTSALELDSVVLLLSAKTTPMARAFEIWDYDSSLEILKLREMIAPGCDGSISAADAISYAAGEGLVGQVWESGFPCVTDDFSSLDDKRADSARADDLNAAIALPIFVGNKPKSVFVMRN